MYNFLGVLMLILIILTLISLILAIFKPKLLMKKFNEKYHSRKYAFAFTLLLFFLIILSAIGLNSATPPEIKAKIQQQQEAQKLEKEKQKAEEEKAALIDAQKKEEEQKELNAIKEKEKAQKVFDDQKSYEEWVPKELERIAKETAGDNFKSIKVNKNYGKEPGAYIIIVQTDAGTGFTNNQVKKSTWFEDMDIFKKLYNSGISIASIKIVTYSTLIDAYGQKKDAPIMKATMPQATANKIVWDNFIIDNFPNITEDYWIHSALLK